MAEKLAMHKHFHPHTWSIAHVSLDILCFGPDTDLEYAGLFSSVALETKRTQSNVLEQHKGRCKDKRKSKGTSR